jgi:anti-anti-sigma factor
VAAAQFAYRKVDSARRVTVLGLAPEQVADEAAFSAARKALLALASRPQSRRMVLDLGALEDLPSGACALLLALADSCKAAGGELRLGGATPAVGRMLTALNLDARIEIYDDADPGPGRTLGLTRAIRPAGAAGTQADDPGPAGRAILRGPPDSILDHRWARPGPGPAPPARGRCPARARAAGGHRGPI